MPSSNCISVSSQVMRPVASLHKNAMDNNTTFRPDIFTSLGVCILHVVAPLHSKLATAKFRASPGGVYCVFHHVSGRNRRRHHSCRYEVVACENLSGRTITKLQGGNRATKCLEEIVLLPIAPVLALMRRVYIFLATRTLQTKHIAFLPSPT